MKRILFSILLGFIIPTLAAFFIAGDAHLFEWTPQYRALLVVAISFSISTFYAILAPAKGTTS